jgi:hypothetical protein
MADRGDPRIHLYNPGSIRGIKNEIETHKARQIEAFHHMFGEHRHLRMIDKSDDARRPRPVLYFHGFDADPCKNFALPANHRPIAGAAWYVLL